MKEAVAEVLPTCCASCCAVKVALCCSFVSVHLSSFYYSCAPSFHSISPPLISSTACPVIFFHPSFYFLLLFFIFSLLHPSSIPKEAVSNIEEAQRVFVYSCCFTVSAPLFLNSDSRFILSKTTEVFNIKPPIAVVKVTLSPWHCNVTLEGGVVNSIRLKQCTERGLHLSSPP